MQHAGNAPTPTAHPHRRRTALLGLLGVVTLAGWAGLAAGLPAPPSVDAPAAPAPARERLLVFSKTGGFRHDSIPDGIACVRELLGERYEIDATEDAAAFTPANLSRYKAVVFLSTTGDILDADQQKAFEGYIHLGGGFDEQGARFGRQVIKIPARRVDEAVARLLLAYTNERNEGEEPSAYFARLTNEAATKLLGDLAVLDATTPDEVFLDIGEERTFKVAIGAGECAA